MYCRAIACDYDGTGASDGHLAPEVAAALHIARKAGIVTLLVTGRVLDDLRVALVDFSAFDAVVAENGAVMWVRESDRTIVLGVPPSDRFPGRLRAARVPLHAGAVVVGTWDTHVPELIALVRETGADVQLVFNRAAVMLLPSGINKAVGTQRALDEVRSALAEEMLSHHMSVAEVAERLGYAKAASFSHAFKRWKGPPEVYRART